jgi:Phage integrase family
MATARDARFGDDVHPHTLRHTAASWLMPAGEDPFSVGGFLGMTHGTIASTYAHHHPGHLGRVGEAPTNAGRNRHSGTASPLRPPLKPNLPFHEFRAHFGRDHRAQKLDRAQDRSLRLVADRHLH